MIASWCSAAQTSPSARPGIRLLLFDHARDDGQVLTGEPMVNGRRRRK
jgi:hypothetical protein